MIRFFNAFAAVCFAMVVFAGEIPLEFQHLAPQIRETCLAKTNVRVELVNQANNGVFIPDEKLKCYIKCTYDEFNLIWNGEINFAKFHEIAPPPKKATVTKFLQKGCHNIKPLNGNICDYIYEISKCFQYVAPSEFFVI